ncbi:hypothetical protein AVEN_128751-1 [Araneus ventricosus]|uniref:EGF-like domain-containing protein n=1 Tax=Araneus ventricosus TaxID=182803 RepID=A0A4Y2IWM9_ARAVE|nr:hypothetical protein AVEN_128751-1 [Araneus ventricosus]
MKKCTCNRGAADQGGTCTEMCMQDTDCQNGGICNTETGLCMCKPHTSGEKCENIEGCDSLNCLEKSAKCIYDIDKSETTCKCDDENSYYENEECNSSPCSNDDECEYPLKCIDEGFGEGQVCSRK